MMFKKLDLLLPLHCVLCVFVVMNILVCGVSIDIYCSIID